MLMQHYHASTNLGQKLGALLRYLQLQLGTPHNPFTLEYDKWGLHSAHHRCVDNMDSHTPGWSARHSFHTLSMM